MTSQKYLLATDFGSQEEMACSPSPTLPFHLLESEHHPELVESLERLDQRPPFRRAADA